MIVRQVYFNNNMTIPVLMPCQHASNYCQSYSNWNSINSSISLCIYNFKSNVIQELSQILTKLWYKFYQTSKVVIMEAPHHHHPDKVCEVRQNGSRMVPDARCSGAVRTYGHTAYSCLSGRDKHTFCDKHHNLYWCPMHSCGYKRSWISCSNFYSIYMVHHICKVVQTNL